MACQSNPVRDVLDSMGRGCWQHGACSSGFPCLPAVPVMNVVVKGVTREGGGVYFTLFYIKSRSHIRKHTI